MYCIKCNKYGKFKNPKISSIFNEARNYFLGKIKRNHLVNNKSKKVCMILNYIERYLNFCYHWWFLLLLHYFVFP